VIFRLIFVSSLKFINFSKLDVSTTFTLKSSFRVIDCRRFERTYGIDLEVSRSRRNMTIFTPHDFIPAPSNMLSHM
jgi:hypothetical protein